MNFEYNKHILEYIARNNGDPAALRKMHLLSIKWLYDNLNCGPDFHFTGAHAGGRSGKSILVVQESIWFNNEDDLLAFRLATGL